MSGPVVIVGGGIVGLSAAYELLRRGRSVVLLEKGAADHDSCSLGNAGMIVPSHFVPLAAPGMVALGLKWMFDRESPFWVRPRLDADLFSWGWKFWRASTSAHVERCTPVLRDLNLRSRELFLRHRVNNLYVTESDGRFLGAVSLPDIKPYLHEPDLAGVVLARDILREDFPRLAPDQTFTDALAGFLGITAERLPVVDARGILRGSLARSDLLLTIAERRKRPVAA